MVYGVGTSQDRDNLVDLGNLKDGRGGGGGGWSVRLLSSLPAEANAQNYLGYCITITP